MISHLGNPVRNLSFGFSKVALPSLFSKSDFLVNRHISQNKASLEHMLKVTNVDNIEQLMDQTIPK